MRFRSFSISFAIVTLIAMFGDDAKANLIHDFQFGGSLDDSLSAASLVSGGGSFVGDGYHFDQDAGLSLAGPGVTGVYTIDLSFSFELLSGYRRILDFKDLGSDTGLYDLNSRLNFFNIVTSSTDDFAPDQMSRLVITRDAAGVVVGYVNGVQAITFVDSSDLASISSDVLWFFRDDNLVPGEASPGFVNQIRIWDEALSADDVAALGGPRVGVIPEPSAMILALTGFVGVALTLRRRRVAA